MMILGGCRPAAAVRGPSEIRGKGATHVEQHSEREKLAARFDQMQLTPGRISRRRLLQLTVSGAIGFGAANLLATATAGAAAVSEANVAAAQAGGKITFLVSSGNGDAARKVSADYTTKTGTQVDVLELPYDQTFQKLQIALSQQTDAYDLASLDDPWMPQFAGGKFLVNLDELYQKTGTQISPDFQPQMLALGDYPPGSGQRALPWLGNIQVYAWRNDLISTRPTTWDDVISIGQTVKANNPGIFGYAIRGAAGNPATTSFLPITRGYGKDVLSSTFEPQLDSPEALAALQTALALRDVAPPGAENTQHADVGQFMYTGVTAQSGDIWPDQLLNMFDPAVSSVVGLISIGPEPSQPGIPPGNMTGTWCLGIPNGSKNIDRTFDFLNFFTAQPQQKRLLMEFNIPPTLVPLFNDEEAVAKFGFLPGLLDAATKAVPRPRTPVYSGVEDIIGRYLSEAIAGQVDPQ